MADTNDQLERIEESTPLVESEGAVEQRMKEAENNEPTVSTRKAEPSSWKVVENPVEGDLHLGNLWFRAVPETRQAEERPRRYSLDEVWKPVKTPAEGDFQMGNLWFRKYTRGQSKEADYGIKRSEIAVGNSDEANKRRKINMGEVWKPVKVPAEGDFQIGGLWFRKSSNNGSSSQRESQPESSAIVEEACINADETELKALEESQTL